MIFAEQSVAGAILIDPRCFKEITERLTEDDFTSPVCAGIFRAASALYAQRKDFDPVILQKWLADHGQSIDTSVFVEMMELVPTAANAGRYAAIVAETARRRRLKELAQTILEDEETATDALLASASAGVEKLVSQKVGGRTVSSGEMLHRFFDELREREDGKWNMVPSGYKSLDDLLGGGFLNGGLYIIAARPGMGKTTFALNIADKIEGGVLFVSLEMSENQLTAKRISSRAWVPASRLLLGKTFSDEEYGKICIASADISESGMVINRRMGATVAEVAIMAHSVQNLRAVFVDYLGLLRPENRRASRYEATTEISGALKQLAISLGVPVIALSQLNRGAEGRENKEPQLSDLRDSGSVEQDADGVLLLYREDYYQPDGSGGDSAVTMKVTVAKNRHAGLGSVSFDAFLKYSRVEEIS